MNSPILKDKATLIPGMAKLRLRCAAGFLLLTFCLFADRDLISNYISSMDNITQIMNQITDVPSAKAAMPKMEDAISQYISFRDQVRRLSFDQRKDRNREMQEAYIRMTDQLKRLRENAPLERELHATLARLD